MTKVKDVENIAKIKVIGIGGGGNNAIQLINDKVHPEANIIFGTVIDEELKDEIIVTVIATGVE